MDVNLPLNTMVMITLQDIRKHGAKAIPNDQPVYLIVNSKPKSVIVPLHEYESLVEALEELEDIHAIEQRKNEKNIAWADAFPS